jgi:hypothetical protein
MKVGSLVELVDDNWRYTNGAKIYPIKGSIYEVREVLPRDPKIRSVDSLLLCEIVNPPVNYTAGIYEPCFNISRFRELQPPMKISIEEFIKIEI